MHYNKNAGKPWIRQSFFRQCFKITISPKFCTAKVLFYTVISSTNTLEKILSHYEAHQMLEM